MSARPIAAGTISFGLVSIPVKLYAASDASAGVSFNMLHAKDAARLKQQYICTKDGEIVPRDQMVKGYEFAKDQYVTFTPEELKALEEQSTQSIEVVEFVPIDKVDPVYFDKTYYVGPDKGGAKAYALLSKVMQETGRVALARYAARGKQYLVMLRPLDDGIVMQQLLLRRRGPAVRGRSRRDGRRQPEGARPREAARRAARGRRLQARDLRGRRQEARARPHPEEGRGRGDLDRAARGRRRPDHRPDGGAEGEPGEEAGGAGGEGRVDEEPASAEESARKPAKRAPARVAPMRTEAGGKS